MIHESKYFSFTPLFLETCLILKCYPFSSMQYLHDGCTGLEDRVLAPATATYTTLIALRNDGVEPVIA